MIYEVYYHVRIFMSIHISTNVENCIIIDQGWQNLQPCKVRIDLQNLIKILIQCYDFKKSFPFFTKSFHSVSKNI